MSKKKKKLMSIKKYLKHDANCCPYCESESISGSSQVEYSLSHAYRGVMCESCGKSWEEEFTITGITKQQENER